MKKTYHEVTIHKKSLNKKVFVLVLCVFILILTSFLSFLISPILNLNFLIATNKNVFEKTYYFVCLNTQTNSKDDAIEKAQNIKSRGGAGVLIFDEQYFVIASCYEEKEKATNIAKNLTTEENLFSVKEESFFFSIKNFTESEKQETSQYVSFLTEKLHEIYALANKLDQKEETNVSVNLKLKTIKNETNVYCQKLLNDKNEKFSLLQSYYLKFLSAIEYASSEKHLDNAIIPYSSILREMICHSILSFKK